MPDDDSGTVEFRQAERDHANGRDRSPRRKVQVACDRCTQGVMDATNDHLRGVCECPCHNTPRCGWCGDPAYLCACENEVSTAAAGDSPTSDPAAADRSQD